MNMLWQHIQWYSDKEQRYLRIWVSGKTGGRWLIAKHHAADALGRLSMRRSELGLSLEDAIAAKSNLQVFTYATFELLNGTDIHTLARQMGTSVNMLERHYSKLTATLAAGQLG